MENNQDNVSAEPSEQQTRKETTHPFNKENLARINGRMGRLDFAILSLGLLLAVTLIQKLLGINLFLVGMSIQSEQELVSKNSANTYLLIATLGLFAYALLSIKRFHDINYSGWLALVFVIPLLPLGFISGLLVFVGLILRLILLFAKGESNSNRFGPIPDGNNRNKLFILVGILVFIYLVYSNLYSEAKPIIEPIIEQMLEEMQQQ